MPSAANTSPAVAPGGSSSSRFPVPARSRSAAKRRTVTRTVSSRDDAEARRADRLATDRENGLPAAGLALDEAGADPGEEARALLVRSDRLVLPACAQLTGRVAPLDGQHLAGRRGRLPGEVRVQELGLGDREL